MNKIDLEGKRAVITGGARGIGLAVAERFLASGAEVSLWDRDPGAIDAATKRLAVGKRVHGVAVDVTDENNVATGVSATLGTMGGIDILVNNAGITGPNATTWEYPVADWKRVIDVDLNGPFLCSRAVVPTMLKGGYGRIVNVASVAGKEGNPNAPAYSAAKAGLIALTKSLGKELAKSNVLVNCVTPAVADTDILKQMSEAHVAFMLGKIPMGRFVKIDEIAALVAWLASADCSFTTGGVFDITGGRSTY
jgi:NAD(P)-dependent dehydrogenase (short-subunit alcohol dehydrogenase family)